MSLKQVLSQIEPDRDNLRHDRSPLWIIADPPWHTDAVGGAVTSSTPFERLRGFAVASIPHIVLRVLQIPRENIDAFPTAGAHDGSGVMTG